MENQKVEGIEAEYTEDLYTVDYKGKRLSEKKMPVNISMIEEKVDRLSVKRGMVDDLEKKINRILSKRLKK